METAVFCSLAWRRFNRALFGAGGLLVAAVTLTLPACATGIEAISGPSVAVDFYPSEQVRTLRLGLLNFESETSYSAAQDNVQTSMVKYLRSTFPQIQFDVKYFTTQELATAIENRGIDFFLGSSGFYVSMLRYGVRDIATLTSPQFRNPNYVAAGAFIVRKDRKDLTDLASLQGRIASSTHPLNFMTYQINLGEIQEQGFEADHFFKRVAFTDNSPRRVIESVLEGSADVGLLRACMLEAITGNDAKYKGKFRVVSDKRTESGTKACAYSTALYPGWTMGVVPGTNPKLTQSMAVALLSMQPSETPSGYTWSIATDFDHVIRLFRTLRIGPYAYLREWTIRGVVEKLWPWLAFFLGLLLAGTAHAMRVSKLVDIRTRELKTAIENERKTEVEARKIGEQLDAMQRVGAIGQLSSVFVHELGQPLTTMNYSVRGLETLIRRHQEGTGAPHDADRIAQCLRTLRDQLRRSRDIIDRVRGYAKDEGGREALVHVKQVVLEMVDEIQAAKRLSDPIQLDLSAQDLVIRGNALEMRLLVLNLLKNAGEAVAELETGHEKQVTVSVQKDSPADRVVLSVSNSGRVLDEQALRSLTVPLTSRKEKGLGLGLMIVRSIVEAHRGNVSFNAREGGGLRVQVRLPCATNQPLNQ